MHKTLVTLLFALYSAILVKILVFKEIPTIHVGHMMFKLGGTETGEPNFIPFNSILSYLLGERGLLAAGVNLIGNVVLLIPIGFLAPFLYRKLNWKTSLIFAIAIGIAIEGTQALLQIGIFDIDDVILNGLGVMIGYAIYVLFCTNGYRLKNSES